MNYKKDDIVKVAGLKFDSSKGILYGMLKYARTYVTIETVRDDYYFIKEDYGVFKWTDDMFTGNPKNSSSDDLEAIKKFMVDKDLTEKDILNALMWYFK